MLYRLDTVEFCSAFRDYMREGTAYLKVPYLPLIDIRV
jgi:hypothetical protein